MEGNTGLNSAMEALAETLARNILSIIEHKKLNEPKLIARGIPAASAHRGMIGQTQNMTVESIQKWAKALDVKAWQLLVVGSNPADLPVCYTKAEFHAEVDRQLREAVMHTRALRDQDHADAGAETGLLRDSDGGEGPHSSPTVGKQIVRSGRRKGAKKPYQKSSHAVAIGKKP